jgi:uncharacterized Ntn-hydrolase superfamily protein
MDLGWIGRGGANGSGRRLQGAAIYGQRARGCGGRRRHPEEYQASGAYAFEDRILRAIEAGRDAGGQEEGQCSASLLTFGRDEFSRSDLRVDLSDEPIAELRRVYDFYAPLVPYYVERARNHKIGRYKDFLKRNGHARSFGPRP